MGYKLDWNDFRIFLKNLSSDFQVYAPKRFPQQGRYSDTDCIRYAKIASADEIEYAQKSTYPAKEVLQPINETVMYFVEGKYIEAKEADERPYFIFARACDINAIARFDDIYLKNGHFADPLYQKRRQKVHFALMQCPEKGWDSCFCVSMGTNSADEYGIGIAFCEDGVKIDVKDTAFEKYLAPLKASPADFSVKPVSENIVKVEVPEISSKEIQQKIKSLDMWHEYDKRCLECGSCTLACSTCTCFTTVDITYTPETNAGERRRIAASCHIDGFSDMAGGHSFRPTAGERMRYKVMHKVHDHKVRFGHNMCVGCGRCDDHCPAYISFSTAVNKLAKEVKRLEGERENG